MDASHLLPGDIFTEAAALDKHRTVKGHVTRCTTSPGRVHVPTDAGDWCIPACAPVTLLDERRGRADVAA